jgi:phosphoesterase RecJ-like protein
MSKFHETHPEILSETTKSINIDHHESNDYFATVNIVEPKAASTTQILYSLYQKWGFEIDEKIATCLMTGLYFDTGSFRHNNTTPEVMKISSDLLKLGANIKAISKNLFKTNSINKLKLWGRTLSNIRRNQRNIITSAITKEDYEICKTESKDLEGVVDYLNAVPDSKFCILLSEDQKGGVKASLRTQSEKLDLSKIAEVFGGGGHKMASGFRIEGKIKEEKHWIID